MEYFKNVDKQVECTRTGFDVLHDGYLSNSIINVPVEEGFKSSSVLKKVEKKKKDAEKKAKSKADELAKKFSKGRLDRDTREATFTKKLNDLSKNGKKKVLKRILTEMYIDSLYLDDDFKLDNFNAIADIVENYLDNNGGYTIIENAYRQTGSHLIKKIMDICEETSKKVTKRITEEAIKEKNHEMLSFDLTNEEVKEFDYAKSEIGLDQISNIIRDKVLSVVKDEQEREAKHAQLMEDIESELSEDPSVKDEKTIEEALHRIFVQSSPTEEATLFNSLLRDCYKSVIENANAIFKYNTLTESVGEDEDTFLADITLDDVELEEDTFLDSLESDDELSDEDAIEIFEAHSSEIIDAIENEGENLEEALKNITDKMKNLSKKTKSKKKAKSIKKDIRKIQKHTEELFTSADLPKTKEGCSNKVIESFVDELEESVDILDNILEAHLNAELDVMESITEAKNGKGFVKPIMSNKDKKLKDIKFMYKIKAVEKEISNLTKKVKSERSGNKLSQIVDKNLKILDNLKVSINDKNKLSAINSLEKKLEKIKKDLSKKINALRENYEFEDDFDYDMISFEDVQEGCFQEDIDFEDEEYDDENVEECTSINMDMVLVEAIARYTLLEMCHTLNLERFDSDRVRRIATSILNKK